MLHEILVAMGSRTPELLRVLLREARGIELAGVEPQPGPQSVVNLNHPPYAADAVLLERHGNRIISGLVYEVQLTNDDEKRIAWPIYMAVLRGTYRVPIRVVVLTISRAVARWAAEPIVLDGGSSIIAPTVIGPDQIPSIDAPDHPPPLPELAVLSTMAHGRGRSAEAVGRAALAAIEPLDPDARTLYTDVVLQSLSKRVRELLEAEMRIKGYEYKSKVLRDAFKEGEAKGEAKALLKALSARGIEVGEALRLEILACQDLARLDAWLEKAVRADSLADVFG